MKIAVFGSGGVGGYFGGRLAQAGESVVFIARGAHLDALRSSGLQVTSIRGDFHIDPLTADDDPSAVGPVDMILLAVKAWQVPEAAAAMRPMLGPDTGVAWLGNGIEAIDQLINTLGPEPVIGGLTRISAVLAGPGHIRHSGIEPHIAFAELDGRHSRRTAALRQAFERAEGLTVSTPPDIQAAMWDKFIFIASISGVGAVSRAPVGVLRSVPETRRLLEAAVVEAAAVAAARGIRLPTDHVERTLDLIDRMAPEVTASMQRDIMDGRPSELEAQNGAVVRLGQKTGVATPTHAFIYAALLPQEKSARGK